MTTLGELSEAFYNATLASQTAKPQVEALAADICEFITIRTQASPNKDVILAALCQVSTIMARAGR